MKNLVKLFALVVFTLFVCTSAFFITANAEESCYVTSVKASHILVDTKEEADLIKARVESGGSFESLAKKYSKCPSGQDGGDLGYFKRRQMVREFEDAAFNLPVGKVSEPVRTQFGWHVIKVYDKR